MSAAAGNRAVRPRAESRECSPPLCLPERQRARWRGCRRAAPRAKSGDVIRVAHRRHDTERGAAESGVHLGDYLEGIFSEPKEPRDQWFSWCGALACPSSQAVRVPLIGFEIARRRHLHIIKSRHVEGAVAADPEVDAGGGLGSAAPRPAVRSDQAGGRGDDGDLLRGDHALRRV